MTAPLQNIRILDFSRIWAGPHATKLLADMGAEVVKVESTRAWDPHRTIVGSGNLPDGDRGADPWNRSGWFNTLHMSKRGITAEVSQPAGKALIEELVSISDVVVDNFRAGAMARRGLSYEDLRRLRPDIIVASMPAFGNTGPWRDFIQYGIGQEQLGGVASMNGYLDDASPVKSGVNFGDPISGAHAAGAILAALLYRRRTGKSIFLDLSQLESTVSVVGEHILGYQMNGREPRNVGNRHPVYAPHGVYRCRGDDSWVTVAVGSDREWRELCQAMGRPELCDDPRFVDVSARHRNHDELDEIIGEWTKHRDATELMQALQARRVPSAPGAVGRRDLQRPAVSRARPSRASRPFLHRTLPHARSCLEDVEDAGGDSMAVSPARRAQRLCLRRTARQNQVRARSIAFRKNHRHCTRRHGVIRRNMPRVALGLRSARC